MGKVLTEFQGFYRRNSGSWLERYEYKESAHHLLLMAFLQRIVNAGGDIIREMAVGNGRIDMLVKFGEKHKQEFALELCPFGKRAYSLKKIIFFGIGFPPRKTLPGYRIQNEPRL
jgi:hypothetical protein